MASGSLPFVPKSLKWAQPSPLLSRTLAQTRHQSFEIRDRPSSLQFSSSVFIFGEHETLSLLVRYSKTLPDSDYRVRWIRRRCADDDASPIRSIGVSPRTRWRFINYFRKKGGKVFPITVFCEGLPRATRQGVRLMATRAHRSFSSSSYSSSVLPCSYPLSCYPSYPYMILRCLPIVLFSRILSPPI